MTERPKSIQRAKERLEEIIRRENLPRAYNEGVRYFVVLDPKRSNFKPSLEDEKIECFDLSK